MTYQFEADLAPAELGIGQRWPRVRFNFDNGWSASLVIRTVDETDRNAPIAALAAAPTGQWQHGKTELGEQEASADEAIAFLAGIAARPSRSAEGM